MSPSEASINAARSSAACPARVYEYWPGGSYHGPADREAAEEVISCHPQVVANVRAARAFSRRVAWYAANGCSIRQFLDIGAGLPGPDATHETVRRASPGCRITYADSDPLVAEHARGQVGTGSGCIVDYVCADIRQPADLLAAAGSVLDFAEPTAVLLLGVLQFIPDSEDPAGIVADLAARLAPRSMIAISHLTADFAPGPVAAAVAAYNARVAGAVYPRGEAEVTALFGGQPLKYPGVVPVGRWRPSFRSAPGGRSDVYGGVAALPPPGGRR